MTRARPPWVLATLVFGVLVTKGTGDGAMYHAVLGCAPGSSRGCGCSTAALAIALPTPASATARTLGFELRWTGPLDGAAPTSLRFNTTENSTQAVSVVSTSGLELAAIGPSAATGQVVLHASDEESSLDTAPSGLTAIVVIAGHTLVGEIVAVNTAQFSVEMAVLMAGLGCSSGDEQFGVVYAIPAASQAQREPWQYMVHAGWGDAATLVSNTQLTYGANGSLSLAGVQPSVGAVGYGRLVIPPDPSTVISTLGLSTTSAAGGDATEVAVGVVPRLLYANTTGGSDDGEVGVALSVDADGTLAYMGTVAPDDCSVSALSDRTARLELGPRLIDQPELVPFYDNSVEGIIAGTLAPRALTTLYRGIGRVAVPSPSLRGRGRFAVEIADHAQHDGAGVGLSAAFGRLVGTAYAMSSGVRGMGSIRFDVRGVRYHFTCRWTMVSATTITAVRFGGTTIASPTLPATTATGVVTFANEDAAQAAVSAGVTFEAGGEVALAATLSAPPLGSLPHVHAAHARMGALLMPAAFQGSGGVPGGTLSLMPARSPADGLHFLLELPAAVATARLEVLNRTDAALLFTAAFAHRSAIGGVWALLLAAREALVTDGATINVYDGDSLWLQGDLGLLDVAYVALLQAPGDGGAAGPPSALVTAVGVAGARLGAGGELALTVRVAGLEVPPQNGDNDGFGSLFSTAGGSFPLHFAPFTATEGKFGARGALAVGTSVAIGAAALDWMPDWTLSVVATAAGVALEGRLAWARFPDRYLESSMVDGQRQGTSVTLIAGQAGSAAATPVVGYCSTYIDADAATVDYTVRVERRVGARACPPDAAQFTGGIGYQGFAPEMTGTTGFGRWELNGPGLIALAGARIRVMVRDDDGTAAFGWLNAEKLYVPRPDAIYMAETAQPGTQLFSNDAGRPFVLSLGTLQFLSMSDLFEVDADGRVALQDAGYEFDYSLESSVDVRLRVTDGGPGGSGRQDVISATVQLIDVNNKPPRFTQRAYSAEVQEGLAAGAPVLTLRAYDGDPAFPELTYSWYTTGTEQYDPEMYLRLVPHIETDAQNNRLYVGRITTTMPFSLANLSSITATVAVSDGANELDIAVINVAVVDVNDNRPLFAPPALNTMCDNSGCTVWSGVTVPEDVALGTVLYNFSASDVDLGPNGEVGFSLTGTDQVGEVCDDSTGLFTTVADGADPVTGAYRGSLRVQRRLDFESKSEYRICLVAQDAGAPPLSSVLVLVITTTDVPFGLELSDTTLTLLRGALVPYGTADPAFQVTVTGNGEDGIETNLFEVTILNETIPCPSSPGVAARACTYAATLPDGEYELSTRGFLGNSSFGELDIGFVVDTNGPVGFIVSHPARCRLDTGCEDGETPAMAAATAEFAIMHFNSAGCDDAHEAGGTYQACRSIAALGNDCTPCQSGAPVTYLCRLDLYAWDQFTPCPMATDGRYPDGVVQLVFRGLADGRHTVEIKMVDALGNDAYNTTEAGQSAIRYSWIIDTNPPQSMISRWPALRASANTMADFEIASDDQHSLFVCELDGTQRPCDPHFVSGFAWARYAELGHGLHTFRALVQDTAGNIDLANVPTYTWFVDREAPTIAFDQPPEGSSFPYGGLITTNTWDAYFSANEPVARFECRFAAVPFPDRIGCCEIGFRPLAPGCIQPCIDAAAPASCTATSNATIRARRVYSSCAVDRLRRNFQAYQPAGGWEACASPYRMQQLEQGVAYSLEVVATDLHGNALPKANAARWFYAVDRLSADRPTEAASAVLNSAVLAEEDCAPLSMMLILACVIAWTLLVLVIGLMGCGLVSYKPPVLGEMKGAAADVDISYDDAMAMMGMKETSLDSMLHTEPGYIDSFGMNKFDESDEVSTDPVFHSSINPVLASAALGAYHDTVPKDKPVHSHTLEASSDPAVLLTSLGLDPNNDSSDDDRDEDMGFGAAYDGFSSSDEESHVL